MAYVYRHIRLDKNEPFYIGIGTTMSSGRCKRAFDKSNRNRFWNFVANKTEFDVEIIFDNVDLDYAIEKEKEFIELYGLSCNGSGTLTNIKIGGDYMGSPYSIKIPKSNSHKEKIRNAHLNRKRSKEHQDNLNKAMKGRVFTEKGKIACSVRSLGGKNPTAKKVIDTSNGKIYDCIKDAAIDLNINATSLRCYLLGYYKNKTNITYYYGDN
jgi:hypothetical protein